MSTVHVFVGQCGTQLGTAFLDSLAAEAEASRSEAYQIRVSAAHFRPPLKAAGSSRRSQERPSVFDRNAPLAQLPQPRCVMVDMEPKVIEDAIRRINGSDRAPTGDSLNTSTEDGRASANPRHSYYCLAPQQCVTRGEGSANNWAYGYYEQGESRREAIAECLRRESEAKVSAAAISTYHVMHSVAGGTGSGVGCLVAEVIRDLYPRATLMHSIVWPFEGGEVVTQWYNTILAMSGLRDSADAVCIAYNDVVSERLHQARRSAAKGGAGQAADTSVTYTDINRQIARLWSSLHLPQLLHSAPATAPDATRGRVPQESVRAAAGPQAPLPASRRYACVEDVIEAVALDPAKKFFTSLAVPNQAVPCEFTTGVPVGGVTTSWAAVLGHAARTSREAFASSPIMGCSGGGALWMLRGTDARTEGLRALQDVMSKHGPPNLGCLLVSPDVSPPSGTGGVLTSTRPTFEVALHGHTKRIPEALAFALERTEKQLTTGAFIHQYARYGVDKETFRDCTMRLWDTVHAYSEEYSA